MSSAAINPTWLPVNEAAAIPRPLAVSHHDNRQKLALVIPTLREAGGIRSLLDRVRAALCKLEFEYEILVVDDSSDDGTAEIVAQIAQEDPRIRLLQRQGQRGLSGAVLHGWQHTEATMLGVMDADSQHPPELLPALISSILEGRDLAIGSRYAKGGATGKLNRARKLISSMAVWATWPIQRSGLRVHDPMSGFFLVRRSCIENISFMRCGFKLLLEILVRARLRSVQEIAFTFAARHSGQSKANLKVACDYARLLVRLYCTRFELRRPTRIRLAD